MSDGRGVCGGIVTLPKWDGWRVYGCSKAGRDGQVGVYGRCSELKRACDLPGWNSSHGYGLPG